MIDCKNDAYDLNIMTMSYTTKDNSEGGAGRVIAPPHFPDISLDIIYESIVIK